MLGNYQLDPSTLPAAPDGYTYSQSIGPSGPSLVKLPPSTTNLLAGLAMIAAGAWALWKGKVIA